MRKHANERREKAVSMAMKRKEEYLGARVPKELRDRVILKAKELGIPVSILIRNILEDAFKDSPGIQVDKHDDNAKDKFESVLGWEKITLNKSVPCSGCGVQLQRDTEVVLGLGSREPAVLCGRCKANL